MSLIKDGLWGIVDGSETAPAENDGAYSKFITHKDRALAIIVLSIDPSLLYLIGDPTDPTVVWKRLSTQFQKKTWANKLALRRQLHSLRLKEGQSVQEHVKALTEIFNELSIIGAGAAVTVRPVRPRPAHFFYFKTYNIILLSHHYLTKIKQRCSWKQLFYILNNAY